MRLIDADRLFSERPEFLNPIHEENGEFNKGWNACINTFCDIIKEQPTAYDVEKVVEELDECSADHFGKHNHYDEGMMDAYDFAIDIVKRGGVNED